MQAREMEELAEGLLSVAFSAARLQMAHFAAGVTAETKADLSPVTIADRQSEEVILAGLARVAPGVPVVSEEAASAGIFPPASDSFFLVDPLDGTKQFIKGSPQFTINIGLITDRRPVFGLVYAPAIPDFFVTVGPDQALGARLSPSASPQRLADCSFEPLRTRAPAPTALSALTSQSHVNAQTRRFLEQHNVRESRGVASSLKFGLLARGEADLYPRTGETSEWDTAAGHAVLAAAGGSVTTLDGEPLLYGKPRFLNPAFVAWARTPLVGAPLGGR
jgi:3'(2'), 5'-bisphosphate nucleotidase